MRSRRTRKWAVALATTLSALGSGVFAAGPAEAAPGLPAVTFHANGCSAAGEFFVPTAQCGFVFDLAAVPTGTDSLLAEATFTATTSSSSGARIGVGIAGFYLGFDGSYSTGAVIRFEATITGLSLTGGLGCSVNGTADVQVDAGTASVKALRFGQGTSFSESATFHGRAQLQTPVTGAAVTLAALGTPTSFDVNVDGLCGGTKHIFASVANNSITAVTGKLGGTSITGTGLFTWLALDFAGVFSGNFTLQVFHDGTINGTVDLGGGQVITVTNLSPWVSVAVTRSSGSTFDAFDVRINHNGDTMNGSATLSVLRGTLSFSKLLKSITIQGLSDQSSGGSCSASIGNKTLAQLTILGSNAPSGGSGITYSGGFDGVQAYLSATKLNSADLRLDFKNKTFTTDFKYASQQGNLTAYVTGNFIEIWPKCVKWPTNVVFGSPNGGLGRSKFVVNGGSKDITQSANLARFSGCGYSNCAQFNLRVTLDYFFLHVDITTFVLRRDTPTVYDVGDASYVPGAQGVTENGSCGNFNINTINYHLCAVTAT